MAALLHAKPGNILYLGRHREDNWRCAASRRAAARGVTSSRPKLSTVLNTAKDLESRFSCDVSGRGCGRHGEC